MKFIGALLIFFFVAAISLIICIPIGLAIGNHFFDTRGLIGIGGISDAMIHGTFIGLALAFVLTTVSLILIYYKNKEEIC